MLCLDHFLGINPCAVVCSSKLGTRQWWYFTKTWLPHLSALPALLCSIFLVYECVYSLAPTSRELHFSWIHTKSSNAAPLLGAVDVFIWSFECKRCKMIKNIKFSLSATLLPLFIHCLAHLTTPDLLAELRQGWGSTFECFIFKQQPNIAAYYAFKRASRLAFVCRAISIHGLFACICRHIWDKLDCKLHRWCLVQCSLLLMKKAIQQAFFEYLPSFEKQKVYF